MLLLILTSKTKEEADKLLEKLNKSLVGSRCFIDNEVVIPNYDYNESEDIYTQEVIIGGNDDNNDDLTLNIGDISKVTIKIEGNDGN